MEAKSVPEELCADSKEGSNGLGMSKCCSLAKTFHQQISCQREINHQSSCSYLSTKGIYSEALQPSILQKRLGKTNSVQLMVLLLLLSHRQMI